LLWQTAEIADFRPFRHAVYRVFTARDRVFVGVGVTPSVSPSSSSLRLASGPSSQAVAQIGFGFPQ
jgi:hypothetical protein